MKITKLEDKSVNNQKTKSVIITSPKFDTLKRITTKQFIENEKANNCKNSVYSPIESYNANNSKLKQNFQNKELYPKKFQKKVIIKRNMILNSYSLEKNDINFPILTEVEYSNSNYNINNNPNKIKKRNLIGLKLKDKMNYKLMKNKSDSIEKFKLRNKINVYKDNAKKIATNSINFIPKNNKKIKIFNNKTLTNKSKHSLNDGYLRNESNRNCKEEEVMPKELFNLFVKKLNKSIEENEKYQKIIKKLKEDNNKLRQKILLDSKKAEFTIKMKNKEINEIQKSKDNLKSENEKLKNEVLNLLKIIKENNNKMAEGNLQNNQLDSVYSFIGGFSAVCRNSTEKE